MSARSWWHAVGSVARLGPPFSLNGLQCRSAAGPRAPRAQSFWERGGDSGGSLWDDEKRSRPSRAAQWIERHPEDWGP